MLTVKDHPAGTAANGLRDLADRIDEAGEGQPVVCVIGSGPAAKIYVLGGDLAPLLIATSALLSGIVDGLPMANTRAN